MSSKNGERRIISSKDKKIVNRKSHNKSPFKKDKTGYNLSINRNDLNMTLPTAEINLLENNINTYNYDLTEEKGKFLSHNNKKAYLTKLNNNMKTYGFTDNSYLLPMKNSKIPSLTDSVIFNNNNIIRNNDNGSKNKAMRINSKQILKSPKLINQTMNNMNLNSNLNKNIISKNNNPYNSKNENLTYNNEPLDSKYSLKINKIKDDYIEFLQKEFEDNTKKNVKLDSNNKELLKKCDDLIHDNRILSNTLNDRTSKLNKIIQENLMIKTELDKCLLTNQKNEQKLEYYEEQFNLFKTSNDNYQQIIKELKEQNKQLNLNLIEQQKTSKDNLKKSEDDFKNKLKEEIQKTKKDMEEFYNNKILEEKEKNDKKSGNIMEQIKELQDKNKELASELTKKEGMLGLACKENEKLTNENSLFRTQLDQYSRQIGELNTIIKHKDNIINNLKQENINNEKFLNKSSSMSMVKLDGSEYINENISKLITDNEENKMKIELLNNKLKSIDEIERKYNEIMNGKPGLTLSEKLAFHMNSNSNQKNNTHFNYNTINNVKNSTFQKRPANKSFNKNMISPKKLQLQPGDFNDAISPIINRSINEYSNLNKDLTPKPKNTGNTVVVYTSNITRDNKRKKGVDSMVVEKPKNNIDREIKITKKGSKAKLEKAKRDNSLNNSQIGRSRKIEIKTTPIKARYFNKNIEDNANNKSNYNNNNIDKNKRISHGKELELEKDEVKESIREMNRKKNYTHKLKNINYSLEEIGDEQRNGEQILSLARLRTERDEEDKNNNKQNKILYLYGIDRNDTLHIFDINNKQWSDMKKISDLVDKSDTFKKDYQYEGTLLYNTLYGVYILTGKKTDTLYYLNSQTNSINKICKFNNCHDNGSIMYDTNSNCIYVFGGKKITSCEYYSFSSKKVYKLPDLITDRANASFIVSNNRIYGFFGFSYGKDTYAGNIEYMDYNKKDKWVELKNIKFLKNDISFDTESVSTMYYRQNPNQILIYCGIQGEEEDFVTDYYLLFDTSNNSMDKINKWNMQQYKNMGKRWKNYNLKNNDPKGFHFAKNSRFILLPKGSYEGYNERDPIDIMIDYKNNVHYILQEKQKIDVYRSEI